MHIQANNRHTKCTHLLIMHYPSHKFIENKLSFMCARAHTHTLTNTTHVDKAHKERNIFFYIINTFGLKYPQHTTHNTTHNNNKQHTHTHTQRERERETERRERERERETDTHTQR